MARHAAPAFVFADLVGYTEMTERHGDHVAACVAREFCQVMSRLSREHGAWHVKSMGDGAMIWAPDAARAVALAVAIVALVGTRADLLPVRVGVHAGPAVMDDDDWYGGTVNLAARLARAAAPNEALISDAARAAADLRAHGDVREAVELTLRGIGRGVTAWRLTGRTPDDRAGAEGAAAAIRS